MRKEFEMTEADLAKLIEAGRPVAYLVANGIEPLSPQDRANFAWQELGARLGFDYLTVQPIAGKGQRWFTAVSTTAAAAT